MKVENKWASQHFRGSAGPHRAETVFPFLTDSPTWCLAPTHGRTGSPSACCTLAPACLGWRTAGTSVLVAPSHPLLQGALRASVILQAFVIPACPARASPGPVSQGTMGQHSRAEGHRESIVTFRTAGCSLSSMSTGTGRGPGACAEAAHWHSGSGTSPRLLCALFPTWGGGDLRRAGGSAVVMQVQFNLHVCVTSVCSVPPAPAPRVGS